MTGTGAEAVLDCTDAAVGSYRPERLAELWRSVPEGLRLTVFSLDAVPEHHRGAFTFRPDRCARLSICGLPVAMQRELTWCMHNIAEHGGMVWTPGMAMLVRRLTEVVTDLGETAPQSLVELSPGDWQQQIAMAVHRRTGRLPGADSAKTVRYQLLRCYRLLRAGYDSRP